MAAEVRSDQRGGTLVRRSSALPKRRKPAPSRYGGTGGSGASTPRRGWLPKRQSDQPRPAYRIVGNSPTGLCRVRDGSAGPRGERRARRSFSRCTWKDPFTGLHRGREQSRCRGIDGDLSAAATTDWRGIRDGRIPDRRTVSLRAENGTLRDRLCLISSAIDPPEVFLGEGRWLLLLEGQ